MSEQEKINQELLEILKNINDALQAIARSLDKQSPLSKLFEPKK